MITIQRSESIKQKLSTLLGYIKNGLSPGKLWLKFSTLALALTFGVVQSQNVTAQSQNASALASVQDEHIIECYANYAKLAYDYDARFKTAPDCDKRWAPNKEVPWKYQKTYVYKPLPDAIPLSLGARGARLDIYMRLMDSPITGKRHQQLLIANRGTDDTKDLMVDAASHVGRDYTDVEMTGLGGLEGVQTDAVGKISPLRFSKQFYKRAQFHGETVLKYIDDIEDWRKKASDSRRTDVMVTGHSLGAAVTNIMAIHLMSKSKLSGSYDFNVESFAYSPPMGNNSQVQKLMQRFLNDNADKYKMHFMNPATDIVVRVGVNPNNHPYSHWVHTIEPGVGKDDIYTLGSGADQYAPFVYGRGSNLSLAAGFQATASDEKMRACAAGYPAPQGLSIDWDWGNTNLTPCGAIIHSHAVTQWSPQGWNDVLPLTHRSHILRMGLDATLRKTKTPLNKIYIQYIDNFEAPVSLFNNNIQALRAKKLVHGRYYRFQVGSSLSQCLSASNNAANVLSSNVTAEDCSTTNPTDMLFEADSSSGKMLLRWASDQSKCLGTGVYGLVLSRSCSQLDAASIEYVDGENLAGGYRLKFYGKCAVYTPPPWDNSITTVKWESCASVKEQLWTIRDVPAEPKPVIGHTYEILTAVGRDPDSNICLATRGEKQPISTGWDNFNNNDQKSDCDVEMAGNSNKLAKGNLKQHYFKFAAIQRQSDRAIPVKTRKHIITFYDPDPKDTWGLNSHFLSPTKTASDNYLTLRHQTASESEIAPLWYVIPFTDGSYQIISDKPQDGKSCVNIRNPALRKLYTGLKGKTGLYKCGRDISYDTVERTYAPIMEQRLWLFPGRDLGRHLQDANDCLDFIDTIDEDDNGHTCEINDVHYVENPNSNPPRRLLVSGESFTVDPAFGHSHFSGDIPKPDLILNRGSDVTINEDGSLTVTDTGNKEVIVQLNYDNPEGIDDLEGAENEPVSFYQEFEYVSPYVQLRSMRQDKCLVSIEGGNAKIANCDPTDDAQLWKVGTTRAAPYIAEHHGPLISKAYPDFCMGAYGTDVQNLESEYCAGGDVDVLTQRNYFGIHQHPGAQEDIAEIRVFEDGSSNCMTTSGNSVIYKACENDFGNNAWQVIRLPLNPTPVVPDPKGGKTAPIITIAAPVVYHRYGVDFNEFEDVNCKTFSGGNQQDCKDDVTYEIFDSNGDLVDTTDTPNDITELTPPGVYTIKYEASNNKGTTSAPRTLTVMSRPIITVNPIAVSIPVGTDYVELDQVDCTTPTVCTAEVYDIVDIDGNSIGSDINASTEPGEYLILYGYANEAGLFALPQYLTVTVEDPAKTVMTFYSGSDGIVTLPLIEGGVYNFEVEWGDGSSDTITAWDQAEKAHTYSALKTMHTITIRGQLEGFSFKSSPSSKWKIREISQWGQLALSSENVSPGGYFYDVYYYLEITAEDAPDLSTTTNMSYAFANSVVNLATVGGWDTSSVTDMSYMLSKNRGTVHDIGDWDTSSVTSMKNIAEGASKFNEDISGWDTSSVTDMSGMFINTGYFDSDISGWDTSGVTNMSTMFGSAYAFNQSIGGWDTSAVTNMSNMFTGSCGFDQPIGSWDTSSVTTMERMFYGTCDQFDQDLSAWDISNVKELRNFLKYTYSLSTENYNRLLFSWGNQTVRSHVRFDVGRHKYTPGGVVEAARTNLVDKGWIINDGGPIALSQAIITVVPLVDSIAVGTNYDESIGVDCTYTALGPVDCANDVSYDIVDANGGNVVDINASTSPGVYSVNYNYSGVAPAAATVTRTVTVAP